INGGAQEGGCAFEMRGGYVEGSWALSEIFFNWSAANNSGTAKVSGVSFNKGGNTRLVTNHIRVEAGPPSTAKLHLEVSSCAFKGFAYTPSAARRVIFQTAASSNALIETRSNYYQNDLERPQFNGWPALG